MVCTACHASDLKKNEKARSSEQRLFYIEGMES